MHSRSGPANSLTDHGMDPARFCWETVALMFRASKHVKVFASSQLLTSDAGGPITFPIFKVVLAKRQDVVSLYIIIFRSCLPRCLDTRRLTLSQSNKRITRILARFIVL